ncbi:MAG: glycosyltransferase family 39 protein [Pseudomonadales bacterium]|nr:glycosyltransferase family 39 protein [Pseudomonadales bacterium]
MTDQTELKLAIAVVLAGLLYLAGSLPFLTMSLDGVIYAGIARDLAADIGSFWALPYFDSSVTAFTDHPPLGIWFLSLWFGIFGDSFWVERLYCTMMAIAIVAAMALLWSRLDRSSGASNVGFVWALLMLFLMPVTTYTLRSNALELLIALIAILAAVGALEGRTKNLWHPLVGVLAAIGFLVKGPVGLFPLAMPFVFAALMDNQILRGIRRSTMSSFVCFTLLASLLFYEPARDHLFAYFDQQILASLTGQRGNDNDRIYLLQHLVTNLAIPMVLSLGLISLRLAVAQRAGGATVSQLRPLSSGAAYLPSRDTLAMIAIGLIASLPLFISPRHYRHYLFPCLPFFALAAAMIVQPKLQLNPKWARRLVTILVLSLVARTALNFGLPGKDAAILNSLEITAIYAIESEVNQLGFCQPDPIRQSYLRRYHQLQSTSQDQGQMLLWVCAEERTPKNAEKLRSLPDGTTLWRRLSPTNP